MLIEIEKKLDRFTEYSEDHGRSFLESSRTSFGQFKKNRCNLWLRGGAKTDGMIYVRPGVKDLLLDLIRYGQVRVMVDDTHYLKGMAVYKEDLPAGVDISV